MDYSKLLRKNKKLGDAVKCKGPCGRFLIYTSLNFNPSRHGHTCKDCLRDKLAYRQRERRARLAAGLPSVKSQLQNIPMPEDMS